jgi:hypothetical protein
VCGIGEPAEIPVDSPAQGLFGSRRLVLERLQLEDRVPTDPVKSLLSTPVISARVISIGTRDWPATSAVASATVGKRRRTLIPPPTGNGY